MLVGIWYIFSNKTITLFDGEFKNLSSLLLRALRSMVKSQNKMVFSALKSQGLAVIIANIVQYSIESLASSDKEYLL